MKVFCGVLLIALLAVIALVDVSIMINKKNHKEDE